MRKITCNVCNSHFVKVTGQILCPKCDVAKFQWLVRKEYKRGAK